MFMASHDNALDKINENLLASRHKTIWNSQLK